MAESRLLALFAYNRVRQAAYRYSHRTLGKEVTITKKQVADRMQERFPIARPKILS